VSRIISKTLQHRCISLPRDLCQVHMTFVQWRSIPQLCRCDSTKRRQDPRRVLEASASRLNNNVTVNDNERQWNGWHGRAQKGSSTWRRKVFLKVSASTSTTQLDIRQLSRQMETICHNNYDKFMTNEIMITCFHVLPHVVIELPQIETATPCSPPSHHWRARCWGCRHCGSTTPLCRRWVPWCTSERPQGHRTCRTNFPVLPSCCFCSITTTLSNPMAKQVFTIGQPGSVWELPHLVPNLPVEHLPWQFTAQPCHRVKHEISS